MRLYRGPVRESSIDDYIESLREEIGLATLNGRQVNRSGIVGPETLKSAFPQSSATLSEIEMFHLFNDWLSFDYLGTTDVPIKDLEYVVRGAGLLPRRAKRRACAPYIAVVAASLKKGYICILRRSGLTTPNDFEILKAKTAIGLHENSISYSLIEFTSLQLNLLAERYLSDHHATKVKHDTSQGWLVYDNPDGIETDEEVMAAESAYGTMRKIRHGDWNSLRIHIQSPPYEISLSKHKSCLKRLTLNPLRIDGYLPKHKAIQILDHVVSHVQYLKNSD